MLESPKLTARQQQIVVPYPDVQRVALFRIPGATPKAVRVVHGQRDSVAFALGFVRVGDARNVVRHVGSYVLAVVLHLECNSPYLFHGGNSLELICRAASATS